MVEFACELLSFEGKCAKQLNSSSTKNSGHVRRGVHRSSVGLVYIASSVNAASVTTGKSHKYHCLQIHEETARCEEGLWIYSSLVILYGCLKLR